MVALNNPQMMHDIRGACNSFDQICGLSADLFGLKAHIGYTFEAPVREAVFDSSTHSMGFVCDHRLDRLDLNLLLRVTVPCLF